MERSGFGISGSTLKLIAIITMLIDHIGAVVVLPLVSFRGAVVAGMDGWEFYWLLRNIGRVSFPIFCFLLVEGFQRTGDVRKYLMRMGAFVLISEIPFDLAFRSSLVDLQYQNVFFTLCIGLFAMYLFDRLNTRLSRNGIFCFSLQILIGLGAMLLAEVLHTEYGAYGVLSILILYTFRSQRVLQAAAGALSFAWELPAPLGFLPVLLYNGKRGFGMKYFFYAFYPLHLLVLHIVAESMLKHLWLQM